jgi:outer membrane protein OmpA-like peptidoglycan-associated protein
VLRLSNVNFLNLGGLLKNMRLILITIIVACHISLFAQDELRKSIYFGGGSYYIDEYQIEELYHWLDSIPDLLDRYEIQLISHTDPVGGREYNEWLSQMRSFAVHRVLLHHSIPAYKISIKDWAYDNPVYTNRSRQGMRLNRRVDVLLFPIIF